MFYVGSIFIVVAVLPWNDPGIAPGFSVEYRARMLAKTGPADEFYRLYMVPGMLHCQGGDAPTDVNWQAALESWVEKSEAPGRLVASDGKNRQRKAEIFSGESAEIANCVSDFRQHRARYVEEAQQVLVPDPFLDIEEEGS